MVPWLNYHHLLYFWVVAREGGLVPAGKTLRLAPPTLSGQIRTLEESLGKKLFARSGRRLVLTDFGRVAFRYADEIFALGRELSAALDESAAPSSARLEVGVTDGVPKMVVRRLLEPVLALDPPVRIVCHHGRLEALVADLGAHAIDAVIADAQLPSGSSVRAFSHPLGTTGATMFARPDMAKRLRRGFPNSLDGAPMLLPLPGSSLRRSIDAWLDSNEIRPRIVAEVEDSALLKALAEGGSGVFAAPTVVQDEVRSHYGVEAIGVADGLTERFFLISPERRIKKPAVLAVTAAARAGMFS
jgi:LysR family transcriptional activator of nhaA